MAFPDSSSALDAFQFANDGNLCRSVILVLALYHLSLEICFKQNFKTPWPGSACADCPVSWLSGPRCGSRASPELRPGASEGAAAPLD